MKNARAERREIWRQLIGQQEKNGKPVRAFCREHGIGEHSFYAWRQRLKQEVPVSFALVEARHASQPAVVEVLLTTGDRLRIPAEGDVLRAVLAALREPA